MYSPERKTIFGCNVDHNEMPNSEAKIRVAPGGIWRRVSHYIASTLYALATLLSAQAACLSKGTRHVGCGGHSGGKLYGTRRRYRPGLDMGF